MKVIVKKLNERGGYVYVPKAYIGKEVEVILPGVLIHKEPVLIQHPIPLRPTPTNALQGLSEDEAKFLDMMRNQPHPAYRRHAEKEFGKDRVKQLLNEV